MWKSATAVPGIREVFLHFAKYFILFMTHRPWKSHKSCEILNMQSPVVTNVHCWTEGNRGHVPCCICPGTCVASQGWAVTMQPAHTTQAIWPSFSVSFSLISLAKEQSFGEKQLVLSSLCGGWCEHRAQCWDMPVQTFSMICPTSQPAQIPMGCQTRLQNLQKTSHDTTRPIGMQETFCPYKVFFLISGQLKNPFGLWEPKVLSMKCSFISLSCWYLGQYRNKIAQIFHRPLNKVFQPTHLYLS